MSFLHLDCTGTTSSVSGDSVVLRVREEILVSILLHVRVRVESYNVLELVCDCNCNMHLGFLTFGRSWESDRSQCESLGTPTTSMLASEFG